MFYTLCRTVGALSLALLGVIDATGATPQTAIQRVTQVNSDTEIVMVAQLLYGEYNGYDKLQQAGVCWVVCNRADKYDMSIEEVITAPYQFHGYRADNPAPSYLQKIADDVLTRWKLEHLGVKNVGRVLPKEYMWFHGNGTTNTFTNAYKNGDTWDWSLPNPYAGITEEDLT